MYFVSLSPPLPPTVFEISITKETSKSKSKSSFLRRDFERKSSKYFFLILFRSESLLELKIEEIERWLR